MILIRLNPPLGILGTQILVVDLLILRKCIFWIFGGGMGLPVSQGFWMLRFGTEDPKTRRKPGGNEALGTLLVRPNTVWNMA